MAEHRVLAAKLDEVGRIQSDPELTAAEKDERKMAILPVTSTWDDVMYFREWVRRFILEQAVTNLGWPAALTAIGVVMSTVAGVWALWA